MIRNSRRQVTGAFDGDSANRLRRGRRLGTALASFTAAGLIGAGTIFVAAPVASAGASSEPPLETIVTAAPAVLQISPLTLHLLDLSATLVWVNIIPNEPIVFSAGGTTLCTATTNYLGVASCNVLTNLTDVLAVVAAGGYTATFAGDNSFPPGFAPSSGKGALIG